MLKADFFQNWFAETNFFPVMERLLSNDYNN